MNYVNCCNKRRFCDAYELKSFKDIDYSLAYYLKSCPICEHSVLVIKRKHKNGNSSEIRKTNEKARKLFEKLKPYILSKILPYKILGGSAYFLRYMDLGSVKKCYSNLSSLQMGKFDNLDLPNIPQKLPVSYKEGSSFFYCE